MKLGAVIMSNIIENRFLIIKLDSMNRRVCLGKAGYHSFVNLLGAKLGDYSSF